MSNKAKNHADSEQNLKTGIAQAASYKISAITGMLQREHERDSSEFDILLPSMLRRIDALSSVIMAATDPEVREIEDLRQVVHG